MVLDRLTFTTRYAVLALAVSLSVFVIGILRAYAVPAGTKRMVPINAKGTTPASIKGVNFVSAKRTGEQVYRQLCAGCHGVKGEGGRIYKKPLTGDRSVGELARFIRESMPPGASP